MPQPEILLDVNVDVKLVDVLAEFSLKATTAAAQGWREHRNGALVAAAFNAGIRCIITRDGLFGESAAKALRDYPKMCIVIITLAKASKTQTFGIGFAKSI